MTNQRKSREPTAKEWKEWLVFHENLLSQRFNFFLVFVGLVVAGIANAPTAFLQKAIAWPGTIVVFLVTLTIVKAQTKIDLIVAELRASKPRDVASLVSSRAPGPSMRWIIGYAVPVICSSALVLAIVLIHSTTLLTVPSVVPESGDMTPVPTSPDPATASMTIPEALAWILIGVAATLIGGLILWRLTPSLDDLLFRHRRSQRLYKFQEKVWDQLTTECPQHGLEPKYGHPTKGFDFVIVDDEETEQIYIEVKSARTWRWPTTLVAAESIHRLQDIRSGKPAIIVTGAVPRFPWGPIPDGLEICELSDLPGAIARAVERM